MKNLITLILIIFLFNEKSYATEQIPDLLIHKNDTVFIYANPLQEKEDLLKKDKRFLKLSCRSTACWRRYQATWELINEKLYLVNISSCCNSKITADLSIIFNDQLNNQKVFADWFTGKIVIPIGERIYGRNIGYSNVYEYEDILTIDNGDKISIKRVDNTKTRFTYLKSDKLSVELIKKLDKIILNEIWKKKTDLDFLVGVETNEKGIVSNVELKFVENIPHKKQILDIIRELKDWDMLYIHGEKVNLLFLYPIRIDRKKLRKYKKYWQ